MRVVTDLVLNHTSTEHEWFQRAREDLDSPYHDYYLWTSHVEDAYDTVNIFPEFEDGVWTYDEVAGKHCFHQFYGHQPDLNVANPAVQEELFSVVEFWLERGVDGFRIDAAHPMILSKGHNATTMDDPQWLFREMKRRARAVRDDAVLLAEADDEPDRLDFYFADGEGFDALFNFVGISHLVYGVGVKDTWPIHRMFEVLPEPSETVWWTNFLRNHDEWNLLKLPWEALEHGRDYFGRGEGETDIVLSGDEIGMGADLSLPERAAVRTPMQWSDERNGGFSTADADELVLPVNDDPEFGYEGINVADQGDALDSLLNRLSAAIDARKRCPEIRDGDFTILESGHREVFVTGSTTAIRCCSWLTTPPTNIGVSWWSSTPHPRPPNTSTVPGATTSRTAA
jgi:maltose alpha-D-glucosyltransferase/alpha-amylase